MIDGLIQIFIYITIADILLSWVPDARGQAWAEWIRKVADVPQKPIRDLFPRDIPIDPSPMIVIILCQVLMYIF
jgi:uncharacterized protein YggT (Ycf19 family)